MEQNLKFYDMDKITSLDDNEVFVFGSNPEGRHGKGAAKVAKDKFNAKYGVGRGWTSKNSYAIPTKNLTPNYCEKLPDGSFKTHTKSGLLSISLYDIRLSIYEFYNNCLKNIDKKFYIAYTNNSTNLNGYSSKTIFNLFTKNIFVPNNVYFHKSFMTEYDKRNENNIKFYEKWGNLSGNKTTIKSVFD